MTNWKLMAEARGANIPAAELEKLVPVLEALETAFAPLRELAAHEAEPVTVYRLERSK